MSIPENPLHDELKIEVPADYDPRKDGGDFMNPVMLEYFRKELTAEKTSLLDKAKNISQNLDENLGRRVPDPLDAGANLSEAELGSHIQERDVNKIRLIDLALRRIETGDYGYCEETEEPIERERLWANPTARRTLEAQERHEKRERLTADPRAIRVTRHRVPTP